MPDVKAMAAQLDRYLAAHKAAREALTHIEAAAGSPLDRKLRAVHQALDLAHPETWPPPLRGEALRDSIIADLVCASCKGTGQTFDCEDEEMMECPRCAGSGRKTTDKPKSKQSRSP